MLVPPGAASGPPGPLSRRLPFTRAGGRYAAGRTNSRASLNQGSGYLAAVTGAFASFAVFGLFTSVAAGFVAGPLHHPSRALAGLIVFVGCRWPPGAGPGCWPRRRGSSSAVLLVLLAGVAALAARRPAVRPSGPA